MRGEDRTREPAATIIVVSFNTLEMTRACLDSVFRETRRESVELIVVDNASEDGSAEMIAAEFPQARLIRSTANLGFAAANNHAADLARGQYLLLLNPDTVILDGAIDRLIAFARSAPRAGIWGGRTLFADGRLNPSSAWRDMSLWSLFCRSAGLSQAFRGNPVLDPEAYGGWARDSEREVDVVTGCFLLIETAFWRELGGFDERFVMYGEDADLCMRARSRGAAPRITPDAVIIHHGGASERVRAAKIIRLFRAKIALMEKHWARPRLAIGRLLFLAWVGSRAGAARILSRAGSTGESLAPWIDVWARRDEWLHGYPGAAAPRGERRSDALPHR